MKLTFTGEGKSTVIWLDKKSEERVVNVRREEVQPPALIWERSSTRQGPTAASTVLGSISTQNGGHAAPRRATLVREIASNRSACGVVLAILRPLLPKR